MLRLLCQDRRDKLTDRFILQIQGCGCRQVRPVFGMLSQNDSFQRSQFINRDRWHLLGFVIETFELLFTQSASFLVLVQEALRERRQGLGLQYRFQDIQYNIYIWF